MFFFFSLSFAFFIFAYKTLRKRVWVRISNIGVPSWISWRLIPKSAVFTLKRFKGDYPRTLYHEADFLPMKFFFDKFPQLKKVTWNELQSCCICFRHQRLQLPIWHPVVRDGEDLGTTAWKISYPVSSPILHHVFKMAEHDLTARMGCFLDRHLVFPLLEFLSVKEVNTFFNYCFPFFRIFWV